MRSLLLFLPLVGLLAAGCDKSGVHPLGRERDTLGACLGPATTWVRSTDTGTEVFLIGEVTLDGATEVPGCFAHAFVEHNSSSHLEYGELIRSAGATSGTFSYGAEYDFRYQPERGVLNRQGSIRIDRDPPLTTPISFTADGLELLLTYEGTERRLTNLADVIDALDPTTQEGADDVMRIYNLPLLVSQSRMLGFGSAGMTQYLDSTASFVGTIANNFTVRVEQILMPHTFIEYLEFEDLTGVIVDGEQRTTVSLSGNGPMEGVLTFRMEGRTRTLRGSVDYANVTIANGVAADGTYHITISGEGEYDVSYTLAADEDLRAVLPVSAP